MKRPDSVHGLLLVLLRQRVRPRHLIGCAALLSAGVALMHRPAKHPRESSEAVAVQAFFARPTDAARFVSDPVVTATPVGWIAAWNTWGPGRDARITARAIAADGAPRGAAVQVSAPESFARWPSLARCGDAVGVGYTATREGERWPPFAHFAPVDHDGALRLAPRVLEGSEAVHVNLLCDGDGWALGHASPNAGYRIDRIGPDGRDRGHVEVPTCERGTFGAVLTQVGDAWLLANPSYDWRRDRSNLVLRWIRPSGGVLARAETPWEAGAIGEVAWSARGAEATITWGADQGFGVRHDPFFARVQGRALTQGPTRLGPRRGATVPALSCDGAGCVAAWIETRDGALPRLYVQPLHLDGAPRGEATAIGERARLSMRGGVSLARSIDERALLVTWVADDGEGTGIMAVRLDVDARPTGDARWIHR